MKEYEHRSSKFHILYLALMFLLAACGARNSDESGESKTRSSSIIVGTLDWQEIGSFPASSVHYLKAKPIGDISIPLIDSRCTGFLISDDVVMTNHHCIPSASYAQGVTVKFNHQSDVTSSQHQSFNCSTFIGNNQELDFALLKCLGSPGRLYGHVDLSDKVVQAEDDIYVVQQNCDYYLSRGCDWSKKISFGKILRVESFRYTHDADTLGGSSGSAVFDQSHKVVALHHAGLGNDGFGRGVENYAVPMSKIVPKLKALFPQVLPSAPSENSPFEDNQTFQKAIDLSALGLFDVSEKISSASDQDWFKFHLAKSYRIVIKLLFSHKSGDLDMRLVDENQQTIRVGQSVNDNETIDVIVPKGSYHFVIYGYKGAINSYSFSVRAALVDGD